MLARLFVIVGGLVVLLLTAALVAPYFIDWTNYRGDFEREAGRVLGRDVQVQGTARARLLPFPSVTFTDVVVAGEEPGEIAMTVEEFSMDAELAPFLSGELLIFDMRLVRPRANLEIGPTGRIDWAVRPSSPFDPRQVTLEKVTITDGRVTVHQRASGRVVTLDNIDVELSARTLAGPWRVNGSLAVEGIPLNLSASTGTRGGDGAMRVRLRAEPHAYPLALETDGEARVVDGAGRYAGTFRLRTVAETAEGEDKTADPGNRISGSFSLDHQRLAVDEFRFETGPVDDPYRAEGQAMVELGSEPSFSITADGAQIRLGEAAEEGGAAGLSADERLAALTAFVAGLPKPAIPGTIAVNLPAIVVGDTTVRDISIRAEPVEEGWNIGSLAATLPGRTRFEGEGLLSTAGQAAFTGNMLLAVGQPSGFAAWLARDVDEAIRRLPAAGFSADVELTAERQRFDNLELILGEARFYGSVDRKSPAEARPSLEVALDGGRLDLEGMRAFASIFVDDAGRTRLQNHDVDLEIRAGPVLAEGLEAERLDAALRLRGDALEIDRLTISGLAQANISATGRVDGLEEAAPVGRVDATVVAVDLAPLVRLLAEHLPENRLLAALDRRAAQYPGLLEEAEVDLVASAVADDGTTGLAVSAEGEAGGTAFSLSLSAEGTPEAATSARLTTNFSARNDEAAALYALFGLPALPLGLAGGAEVELSATGRTDQGLQTAFGFSGEGLSVRFRGDVAQRDDGIALHGNASIEAQDLEPWLAAAGISLPGFGYGLPASLSAEIDYGGGLTVLNGLAGSIADSAISGDLNASLVDGVPRLTGSLDLEALDLRPAAEMVVGSTAFEGGEPWPDTPFEQAMRAPFFADVDLSAQTLWLGEVATAEQASLRLSLDPEGLSVSGLQAQIFGGRIEGIASLANNQGSGLLNAQFSLRDVQLAELLPSAGIAGRADLSASVTSNGKTVNAMAATLAGSGSAALRGLEIDAFDPHALPPILARADALGVDISAEQVAAFAPALVRAGRFRAEDAELAFTVASGVARTPPVRLETEGAQVSVELAADLGARTVSASGSLTYEAGREAMAGSEPTVRFAVQGRPGEAALDLDLEPLVQFLTQRALEREQARVEHMQALLLEAQRLRREVRHFEAIQAERAAREFERVRLEREAERLRRALEAEAQRRREEAVRQAAEEEAAPQEGGADDTIEQRPLPPPAPAPEEDRTGEEPALDIEGLTVEKLMELLGPR